MRADKAGASHVRAGGTLVHHDHELLFTAGDMLGHHHAGIVGRARRHRRQPIAQAKTLTRSGEDLGTAEAGGVGAGDGRLVQRHPAARDGFQSYDQGHELGGAGRINPRTRLLLAGRPAGRRGVHLDGQGTANTRGGGPYRHRRQSQRPGTSRSGDSTSASPPSGPTCPRGRPSIKGGPPAPVRA